MPRFSTSDATARRSEDETEEVRTASSGSSPSRRFSAFPRLRRSGSNKVAFSSGCSEDEQHPVFINGVRSMPVSQHTSPWTSRAASPTSTPGTSVVHDYFDGEISPPAGRPEKKRMSWLSSMPAAYFTPLRSPHSSEGSSPPTVSPRKKLHSRTSSSSSGSGSSTRPNFGIKAVDALVEPSDSAAATTTVAKRRGVASLAPNAHFLALMLLMILIISSPLIKVLSVLLFIGIVVLDDA